MPTPGVKRRYRSWENVEAGRKPEEDQLLEKLSAIKLWLRKPWTIAKVECCWGEDMERTWKLQNVRREGVRVWVVLLMIIPLAGLGRADHHLHEMLQSRTVFLPDGLCSIDPKTKAR